jgi:hypothetical protein
MIADYILSGVGKKMRSAYLQGKISENDILRCYERNKKELDQLCTIGWTYTDLVAAERDTHNPLLRAKFKQLLEQYKQKTRQSWDQNRLSLLKLSHYTDSALGLGLRKVIKQVRNIALEGNGEAEILYLLLQTEFANLTAKRRSNKKSVCYERKDLLLMQLSALLKEHNWRCGVNYNPGKNSTYVIYIYLPNGTQLSWHCNNFNIVYYYNEIECVWDGQVCSTLEKLLEYAHTHFGIGTTLEKYEVAA